MIDLTRTTTALLDGLHDPADESAWAEFDRRYRPILINFARRLGLGDADAADAAQETILQFVKEYRDGRYDRERGRLRAWLLTIARTRVAGIYRKRRPPARGESAFAVIEDEDALSRIWEDERRTVMLREALHILETKSKTADRTLEIFDLLVLRHMPVEEVARQVGVDPDDVYQAKSRVAGRLRTILADLERLYDESVP